MRLAHFYQDITPGFFSFPDFYAWAVQDGWKRRTEFHAVEVGVHTGQSAAFLAVEMHNCGDCWSASLDLVDSCLPDDIVSTYLGPVRHIIGKCHRMLSWEACEEYDDYSLDLVYLDADHEYISIARDIEAWLPKMRQGGILAGHDFSLEFPGVIAAVTERFARWDVWRGTLFNGKYYPTWSVRV